ncbi:hypothetical protein [Streptococcus hyovaginalis]|nr:hypothetical protein [Streptococcus hyovaginalis]MDY4511055.1 hypothetical protein [Streptococcus hyovaginalis]
MIREKRNGSNAGVDHMLLVLETKSEHKETIDMKVAQGSVIKMARFFKE